MEHFQNNNILSAKQHAFRKYHSCETQLVSVINEWASSLDQRKQVDVFILDFEKAFDTVPHELLKSKLYTMGVSHQVLCWVDAFLSDREQSVVVNGSRSNPSKVTSGVPQGSVLGPILFLAYINDIGNAVSSGVRLFADDCVCYRVIDDVSDGHQLQEDINILGQWAKDWGMSFQPVKCNIMTITRKRKPVIFNYMLNGVHLVKVDCVKYLGIHITSDLNWGKHIQNVCNKGNRILGVLRRNLSPCSKDAKLAAYKGLLLPVLEYASSVWDPHQAFLQHNLENIQRRAARFIASDYSREPGSVSSLLRDLNLVPLAERRRQSRIILFAKGIYGQAQIPIDCLRKPLRRSRNMHDMHFCQCMPVPIAISIVFFQIQLGIGIVCLQTSLVVPVVL
ncbi:putative RNA-directed DNA polymerase from mobile element jockey-like [Apostichopus japonicus]|uniref:Putative RNA-directed DNA polymerase from mobile element jockey-like n=1 Tax=Stichopus japonicus TaxID=307972 RepID=A0A2G8JHC3_STIJA|nr:putative RNA-directed DNA polymerase from mobile element jockey-like [Apostichopus japonicus]